MRGYLQGRVTDAQLWRKTLSLEEMRGITNCSSFPEGNLLAWNSQNWILNSSRATATEEELDLQDEVGPSSPLSCSVSLVTNLMKMVTNTNNMFSHHHHHQSSSCLFLFCRVSLEIILIIWSPRSYIPLAQRCAASRMLLSCRCSLVARGQHHHHRHGYNHHVFHEGVQRVRSCPLTLSPPP